MLQRQIVETELVETAHEHGTGLVVWSPLASGILTGKYNEGFPAGSRMADPNYQWLRQYVTADKIEKVRQLTAVAADLGISITQLALVWLLRLPEISSVITGASRPEQVHENMKALTFKDKLTPDVLARIESILQDNSAVQA